ncbi:hypothetical protein [Dactylosporangium sp. NPDC005555]|uniref:hypothetical protein n=1 Tax=Dactylosporangium sp. NPDC005555 TaxID=3154889 RepID=UPI0033BAB51C
MPELLRIVVRGIAAATPACAGTLPAATLAPPVSGWDSQVVPTGSMRPGIAPGDLVVPDPVANLRGLARLRVPKVGLPALWSREGRLVPVLAVLVALIALGRLAKAGARRSRHQRGSRKGSGVGRSGEPPGNTADPTRTPVFVQTFPRRPIWSCAGRSERRRAGWRRATW